MLPPDLTAAAARLAALKPDMPPSLLAEALVEQLVERGEVLSEGVFVHLESAIAAAQPARSAPRSPPTPALPAPTAPAPLPATTPPRFTLNLTPPFALASFRLRDPASIPRRQWLYGRHLIRKEVSVTVSPGGLGKTSLGIAEALSMASGRRLLHDDMREPLRVGVWNGEEPADELERRIAAAALHYGLRSKDIEDRLWVGTGHDLPITIARDSREGRTVCEPQVERLKEAMRSLRLDVLIVDPFASTHEVTENDNGSINKAATAWKKVAHDCDIAIGLAHHTRKLGGRDATAEDSRGADALIAKARDARALNPMSADDARDLGIAPAERHAFFSTGAGGKSNMSPRSGRRTWFRLASVDLGNAGGLNEPSDSVGVVTPWAPERTSKALDESAVARLQAALRGGAGRRWSVQSNEWLGYAVAAAFSVQAVGEELRAQAKSLITALVAAGVLVEGLVQTTDYKSVRGYRLADEVA